MSLQLDAHTPRGRWLAVWAILTIAAALAIFGSKSYFVSNATNETLSNAETTSVDTTLMNCIKQTAISLNMTNPPFTQYWQIWNLCGNQVYNTLLLDDFRIRREKLRELSP